MKEILSVGNIYLHFELADTSLNAASCGCDGLLVFAVPRLQVLQDSAPERSKNGVPMGNKMLEYCFKRMPCIDGLNVITNYEQSY